MIKISKFILLALCVIYIGIHYATVLLSPYIQHDVGLYLSAGKAILEGGRPYVDVIEINPPFIMYFNLIPALIERISGFSLAVSGYCFFLIVEILCCLLFIGILVKARVFEDMLDALFGASCFLFAAHWAFTLVSFGQRAYFVAMFLSVFFVYRYSIYNHVKYSFVQKIFISALGFFAIAMKLHYVVLMIACEAMLSLKYKFEKKYLFPDIFVFLILGLLYLAHFLIIPGMSQFYTYWLGFILRGYSSFNISYSQIFSKLYNERPLFLIMIPGTFAFYLPYLFKKTNNFYISLHFAVLSEFAIVVYFLQSKGWVLHLVPFIFFFFISWMLLVNGLKEVSKGYFYLVAILTIFTFTCFIYTPNRIFNNGKFKQILKFSPVTFEPVIEKFTSKDDKLLFIDPDVIPAYPSSTFTERKNARRLLWSFPLHFIFHGTKNYEVPIKFKKDEEIYYSTLIEDLTKNKPKLLFIRNKTNLYRCPPYFNPTEYLRRRKFFEDTSFKGNYKLIAKGIGFDIFLRIKK